MTKVLIVDVHAEMYRDALREKFPALQFTLVANKHEVTGDHSDIDVLMCFGIEVTDPLIAGLSALAAIGAGVGALMFLLPVKREDGTVAGVRLALGGVGTKPWRARNAEAALLGQPASEESFAAAARAELAQATPREQNAFKVELAQRAIVRALNTLMNGEAR